MVVIIVIAPNELEVSSNLFLQTAINPLCAKVLLQSVHVGLELVTFLR
jgi:hypothetical protein